MRVSYVEWNQATTSSTNHVGSQFFIISRPPNTLHKKFNRKIMTQIIQEPQEEKLSFSQGGDDGLLKTTSHIGLHSISQTKRKITSDDLCFTCNMCHRYEPTLHYCAKSWPVTQYDKNHIVTCSAYDNVYKSPAV